MGFNLSVENLEQSETANYDGLEPKSQSLIRDLKGENNGRKKMIHIITPSTNYN